MGAPRSLSPSEICDVLDGDLVGRLATIDCDGYPHITPLWFHWDGETARMTSLPSRPHVARLRANRRACLVVDDEDVERDDGERPNRQVRLVGDVTLVDDAGGRWTAAITDRYLRGVGADQRKQQRRGHDRVVIELVPSHVVAVGSVS